MFRLDATLPWVAFEEADDEQLVVVVVVVTEEDELEEDEEEAAEAVVATAEVEAEEVAVAVAVAVEAVVTATAIDAFGLPLSVFNAHCGLRDFADVSVSIRKPSTIRLFRASLTTDNGAVGPISCNISFVFATIVFWSSICSGIDRDGVRIQYSRPGVFAALRITTGVVSCGACSHCTAAAAARAGVVGRSSSKVGVAAAPPPASSFSLGFFAPACAMNGLDVANAEPFVDNAAADAAAAAVVVVVVVVVVAAARVAGASALVPISIPASCDLRRGGLLGADKCEEPHGGAALIAVDAVHVAAGAHSAVCSPSSTATVTAVWAATALTQPCAGTERAAEAGAGAGAETTSSSGSGESNSDNKSPNPIDSAGDGARGATSSAALTCGAAASSAGGSGESKSESMSPKTIGSAGEDAFDTSTLCAGAGAGAGAGQAGAKDSGILTGAGVAAVVVVKFTDNRFGLKVVEEEEVEEVTLFSLSVVRMDPSVSTFLTGAGVATAFESRSPRGREAAGVVLYCLAGRDGVRTPRAP